MEIERYDDGVPSWVDLGSPDLAKSKEFYGGLFGWDTPEGPPEAGGYSVCTLNGKTVAGLGPQMNPDFPPAWMTYINVDDFWQNHRDSQDPTLQGKFRDAKGFIPGTDHMPYRNVRQAAENGLCGGRPIVTICESGPRAAIARCAAHP